jgi:hypothetical protein
MRKATETLVHTTWLAEDKLFSSHDNVTDVNWNEIESKVYAGIYAADEVTLISVFAYLAGHDDLDSVSLFDVGQLDHLEKLAVLDALRIHWLGVPLEENLL